MAFDSELSTDTPSSERCIFEQVISDHTWSRHDLDFNTDPLNSTVLSPQLHLR